MNRLSASNTLAYCHPQSAFTELRFHKPPFPTEISETYPDLRKRKHPATTKPPETNADIIINERQQRQRQQTPPLQVLYMYDIRQIKNENNVHKFTNLLELVLDLLSRLALGPLHVERFVQPTKRVRTVPAGSAEDSCRTVGGIPLLTILTTNANRQTYRMAKTINRCG